MLEALTSTHTRNKLLFKFCLVSNAMDYIHVVEPKLVKSSNAKTLILHKFETAHLWTTCIGYNKKKNKGIIHQTLNSNIKSTVFKYVGLDQILYKLHNTLDKLRQTYSMGYFTNGYVSPIIQLVLLGSLDTLSLTKLIKKTEQFVYRYVRYTIINNSNIDSHCLFDTHPNASLTWQE